MGIIDHACQQPLSELPLSLVAEPVSGGQSAWTARISPQLPSEGIGYTEGVDVIGNEAFFDFVEELERPEELESGKFREGALPQQESDCAFVKKNYPWD